MKGSENFVYLQVTGGKKFGDGKIEDALDQVTMCEQRFWGRNEQEPHPERGRGTYLPNIK